MEVSFYFTKGQKNNIYLPSREVNSKSIKPFNYIFFYFEDTLPEKRSEDLITGAIVLLHRNVGPGGMWKILTQRKFPPALEIYGTTT